MQQAQPISNFRQPSAAIGLAAGTALWWFKWVPVLDVAAAASIIVGMGLSLFGAVHLAPEVRPVTRRPERAGLSE